jgi:hypothetical protein
MNTPTRTLDERAILDYLNHEHDNSFSWREASLNGPGKPGEWSVWTENSVYRAQASDLGKYGDAVVDRSVVELKPNEEMPCLRTIFYLGDLPK